MNAIQQRPSKSGELQIRDGLQAAAQAVYICRQRPKR